MNIVDHSSFDCLIGFFISGVASNLSLGVHSWGPKGRNSRPKAENGEGFRGG